MPNKKLYTHPKAKKKMNRPEQILQIAIFNFLRPVMKFQKYKKFVAFHIPNGGYRTEYEGAIFKKMGVMPGVADICVMFPWKEYVSPRTIFIELKAGKGNTTDTQDAFGDLMKEYGIGYYVLAADNPNDAINQMKKILKENGVELY